MRCNFNEGDLIIGVPESPYSKTDSRVICKILDINDLEMRFANVRIMYAIDPSRRDVVGERWNIALKYFIPFGVELV